MSSEPMKAPSAAQTVETEKGLLDQIVDEGRLGRDAEARTRGKDLVREFVAQFLEGEMTLTMQGASKTYRAGDRCDVAAGIVHSARMGKNGCRYLIGER